MRERITIRQMVIVAAAFVFAALLYTYIYVQQFFAHNNTPKLASDNECSPDSGVQQAPKQNPNKILFVSCGGFLE